MRMEESSSKRREFVRAKVNFPVVLELSDSEIEYGEEDNTRAVDLSGVGMRLSVDLDDITDIPKSTKVSLKFQLPKVDYELPPITGTVVRVREPEEEDEQYEVGIEFDYFESTDLFLHKGKQVQTETDREQIIKYVVKRAIYNLKWERIESQD